MAPENGRSVPESVETRIARLEASKDDHAERLRMLFPLASAFAVQEERISGIREDINSVGAALRSEIAEMKQTANERAKERRTMLIALFVAGVGLFGTFVATAVPLIKGNPPPAREQTK